MTETQRSTAEEAAAALNEALVPLIQGLGLEDLQLLVQLIFSRGGWEPSSPEIRHASGVDLRFRSLITDEHALVRTSTVISLELYRDLVTESAFVPGHLLHFLVTSSPIVDLELEDLRPWISLWEPRMIAHHLSTAGLHRWLIDKAAQAAHPPP